MTKTELDARGLEAAGAAMETAIYNAAVAWQGHSPLTGTQSKKGAEAAVRAYLSASDALTKVTAEPMAMTVIDPDQWEPCSPSYLTRGGSCDAPRVWNALEGNHWHPKLAADRDRLADRIARKGGE